MGIRKLLDEKKGNGEPWFIDRINRWFMQDSSRRRKGGYFRPSGISMCARENLYNYLGLDIFPALDLQSIKYMFRGTKHHDIWQEIFTEAGVEITVPDFFNTTNPAMKGKGDWIATDPSKLEHLIEWKSTQGTGKLSWEHNTQWTLYSWAYGIPRGYIVKENPSSLAITPIKMSLNEEYLNAILDWLRMIEQYARDREMLEYDPKCGPGNGWGKSCDVYGFCHSEAGGHPWGVVKL